MTIAVDLGRKATKQTKQTNKTENIFWDCCLKGDVFVHHFHVTFIMFDICTVHITNTMEMSKWIPP